MINEMRDRALADVDPKTQTRRIVVCHHDIVRVTNRYEFSTQGMRTLSLKETPDYAYVQLESGTIIGLPCRYGAPGDRLYLKEDHRLTKKRISGKLCVIAEYRCNYEDTGFRQYKWEDLDKATRRKLSKIKTWGRWRSKLLMYKFIARVWFDVTDIRVERVQDISPEDAISEGLMPGKTIGGHDGYGLPSWDSSLFRMSPVDAYSWLWNSINEDRGYGWNKNPWVWVIVFKRQRTGGTRMIKRMAPA